MRAKLVKHEKNVKVQAEVSKYKLKCQSAEVQIEIHSSSMFKGQSASLTVKILVGHSSFALLSTT